VGSAVLVSPWHKAIGAAFASRKIDVENKNAHQTSGGNTGSHHVGKLALGLSKGNCAQRSATKRLRAIGIQ
jgi:hypothetical protein